MRIDYQELLQQAEKARKFAYAPYSGFCVGAALLTDDDEIYQGCNIENSAYGPSNCAERTAIFKAVSEGKLKFKAIAIVGGMGDQLQFCPPCGVCRQVMSEFCSPDFEIVLMDKDGSPKLFTLKELLPESFHLS